MKKFVTENANQTKALGKLLAEEVRGGEVICLGGDLGSGKTTFTQGFLEKIGAEGPYTSPTFAIAKEYKLKAKGHGLKAVYHIDAYRINSHDLLELGFKDFAGKKDCVTIIEWPERAREIIPKNSLHIHFKWIDNEKREIILSSGLTRFVLKSE